MEELIIDRTTWNRGGAKPETKLKNKWGYCCLGFMCLSRGFTEGQIKGVAMPADLEVKSEKTNAGRLTKLSGFVIEGFWNSKIANSLAGINDVVVGGELRLVDDNDHEEYVTLVSEKHRERLIREYFRKIKIKVKFIN